PPSHRRTPASTAPSPTCEIRARPESAAATFAVHVLHRATAQAPGPSPLPRRLGTGRPGGGDRGDGLPLLGPRHALSGRARPHGGVHHRPARRPALGTPDIVAAPRHAPHPFLGPGCGGTRLPRRGVGRCRPPGARTGR